MKGQDHEDLFYLYRNRRSCCCGPCPVCATAIGDTATGSVPAIRDLLTTHLEDLQSYNDAKTALDNAETAASQAHNRLVARLPAMIEHLSDDDGDGFKTALIAYQASVGG